MKILILTSCLLINKPRLRTSNKPIRWEQLEPVKTSARLINVGRGPTVDEPALITALQEGKITGAALDVFENEPLPPKSPLWSMPQVIVSLHMSGDFYGYKDALTNCFCKNYYRYRADQPLRNIIDKFLGYVPGSQVVDTHI